MEKNDAVKENRSFKSLTKGFLSENVVVAGGLIVAPIVVAGVSVKNAVIISAVLYILTVLTVLISRLVTKKVSIFFRIPVYSLIASILYAPIGYFLQARHASVYMSCGIYLPLLILNAIISVESEKRKYNLWQSFISATASCFGFAIIILTIGTVREVFGKNMFMDNPVDWNKKIPALAYPFSGFILLSSLAAIMQRIRLKRGKTDANTQNNA